MSVEYTGRHYEVTAADRREVESGLSKIKKILRGNFDSKVVLAVEKHRHKAEITINSRVGPLVALSQAKDMRAAIGNALEHLEKQALKPIYLTGPDMVKFLEQDDALNKQLMNARGTRPQWGIVDAKGATTDDPAKEVGRTDLTMGKPAAPVETLKISLTRTDATHGTLDIAWENVTASVPFAVK